ncbi:hypothetical protein Bhyg_12681 [Pseudolycoriella hygida]|uniref:Pacifastin domain-containing protein n=1 Tax=Pseudolycoriella hygida TaxID=35572 RepID=A0A9Q0MYU4_9DIPT|nr:hypothetical protein Bhyg_12681 [Pseudolycoriella hygida]
MKTLELLTILVATVWLCADSVLTSPSAPSIYFLRQKRSTPESNAQIDQRHVLKNTLARGQNAQHDDQRARLHVSNDQDAVAHIHHRHNLKNTLARGTPAQNGAERSRTPRSASCVPNTHWNDGCNDCSCTSNGLPVCTRMHCFKNADPDRRPAEVSGNRNRQVINIDSTVRSKRALPPTTTSEAEQNRAPRSASCVPNTHWNDGCNSCSCSSGGLALCTRMHCFKNADPHRRPAEVFGDRNRQVINIDNTVRSKRAMPPTTTSGNSLPESTRSCKHGTTWMDKCNRCRCNRGRSLCTRMMCHEGDKH